ncbi:hypothetical protein [Metabacillus sediminilitoris]|uniref:Uncharacterized protein n=1 Tax=Metabacillus sediminilitoris TaxID=2567941 RepID=A0A4S4C3E6_9BACI|nr:hypothetical protein [Metabacillus sediminilitoris]QGQ44513.1 hypothetical protein GMB29_04100 [Metabacillus sediminilitoris]THF80137.1 hypothetical protein E6W99_10720 [Metabacillus sediminilitoris]
MKKIAPIFMVLVLIAIIGYFDSPLFTEKEDAISRIPMPTDETASANASNEQSTEESQQLPLLETKLVDITEEDGFVVEVYREYEVIKDEEGNIIESTPTENYQYLKYKK